MDKTLTLAEELLLLGLHDEKGTMLSASALAMPYGLAGAMLIELAQGGLVRIEGKALAASPRGSARDEILDEVLEAVRSSPKARSIDHWVGRFGRSGKFKKRFLARLAGKGIVTHEEGRFLGIFPTSRYPQLDPRPEAGVRERVRSGVLGAASPGDRDGALISLVHACDLVGVLFEKSERREAKARAKEIARRQPIGGAVARAVQAVRTAVIAAAS
jgi:golgi phosphoprotein 3